jgi:hypothetical protein
LMDIKKLQMFLQMYKLVKLMYIHIY